MKNTVEQSFVEKLRSLLRFGSNSRRYRDLFDMFYLKDLASAEKMLDMIRILIFDDLEMRENTMEDVIRRLNKTFEDEHYLSRVSGSRQRWIDNDIHEIVERIMSYLNNLS